MKGGLLESLQRRSWVALLKAAFWLICVIRDPVAVNASVVEEMALTATVPAMPTMRLELL